MNMSVLLVVATGLTLVTVPARAAVVDDLLRQYAASGASGFSVARGERQWQKTHADPGSGKPRSCTTCHGEDLKARGKHVRTGKVIEPLAPSVNGERLTDPKQIRKWFKRNCKWVLGRECTPQEKGDFLLYIRNQ